MACSDGHNDKYIFDIKQLHVKRRFDSVKILIPVCVFHTGH